MSKYPSATAQKINVKHDTLQPRTFPYRGWSIAVLGNNRPLEENYVKAATQKANSYGINTLEFHDYVMPGGIVDALVDYTAFSKLHQQAAFTYKNTRVTRQQKKSDLHRFRKMAGQAKEKGLSVNVWYHVMRDMPDELIQQYPRIQDVNSGFIWEYVDAVFTEFFANVPEVDRITLISLHETPSILKNTGNMSREECLLKLYMTIYDACRRAGKELIIRDFIDTYEDYQTFWKILDKVPPDVYVMTKNVSGDWSHMDLATNPMMNRYKDRKLIVEFDLYGEWSGRGDMPACYPEYIYRQVREMKALNAVGAMGRLVHETRPESELPFPTIFESPVGVNAYAYAKALSEPLPWLGETDRKWHDNIEAINKKYWMMWARDRYNEKAAVPVVRAFERTDQVNGLTFDLAGVSFRSYIWYPTFTRVKPGDSTTYGYSWRNFSTQMKYVGIGYLRDEKQQALKLATQSLNDIRSAKGFLIAKDYADLERVFKGALLIIQSYEAALEGYYAVHLAQAKPNKKVLYNAAKKLNDLAGKIDRERGKKWYFNIATEMRELAVNVLNGIPPTVHTNDPSTHMVR